MPASTPLTRVGRFAIWLGRYAWTGWAGASGLFCVAALWQFGHEIYGGFILASPLQTLDALMAISQTPGFWETAGKTVYRALVGFLLAAGIGTLLGTVSGYSFAAMRIMRPVVTLVMGVPPIAWIVLAIIWFGTSGGSAILTVVIASFPIAFAGGLEGVMARDRALEQMARSYRASAVTRFRTVTLPHLLSYLYPAWITTAGNSWKVAVMAELLSNTGGVGGALADSRAMFDIPQVMAWILLTVIFALATEYVLLQPVREALERWRSAGQAGTVRR